VLQDSALRKEDAFDGDGPSTSRPTNGKREQGWEQEVARYGGSEAEDLQTYLNLWTARSWTRWVKTQTTSVVVLHEMDSEFPSA